MECGRGGHEIPLFFGLPRLRGMPAETGGLTAHGHWQSPVTLEGGSVGGATLLFRRGILTVAVFTMPAVACPQKERGPYGTKTEKGTAMLRQNLRKTGWFGRLGPLALQACLVGATALGVSSFARAEDVVAAQSAAAKTAEPPPNVLFLAIDDLNDWTGFLGGYPGNKTPNLDRLAARGIKFTRAYCAAPACNPSRTALMTGLRPATSGVYLNSQPWRPVMPEAVTMSQHFMAAGYRVEGGGKIFHGGFNDAASWQQYFKQPGDPKPGNMPVNGIAGTGNFDWGPVAEDDGAMADYKVVSWAEEFLAQKQDKPFFLAVGLYKPHLPWYVPEKYFEQFPVAGIRKPEVPADDLDDVPEAGRKMAKPDGDHRKVVENHQWEQAIQGYLASIAFTDGQVGRLLEALDKSPHGKNTIIVMWGDHGWHLGEKQHWRKFSLWEEATRVPMIIAAPGVSGGQACERTVNLLDLYPTLIDLCGLEAKKLDGASLAPLVRNPRAAWDRPSLTTHGRNNHSVRSERWRYIRYADGSEELYDHDQDPREYKNLASDPRHASVKDELAKWLPQTNAANAPEEKQAEKPGKAKKPEAKKAANQGNAKVKKSPAM